MPFKPMVAAGIERVLNTFFYRDSALKAARQRLYGKVLRVVVQEFSAPIVLVFSERQVDVLSEWEGEADCSVITRLNVLPKLRDRQQLTALIRSGELEVQGDIQVVQNLSSLMDQPSLTRRKCLRRGLATSPLRVSANFCAAARAFFATALRASSAISLKP